MTRREAVMIAEELYKLLHPKLCEMAREAVTEEADEYLTTREAAEFLGVSVKYLYRHTEIPRVKLGEDFRYSRRRLKEHLERKN